MPDDSNNPNTSVGAMAPDASTSPVEWSRPIEAVHEATGDTCPAQVSEARSMTGARWVTWPGNATWSDGQGVLEERWDGWRIRNVQPTTPELDPALRDRMVALVQGMAGNSSMGEPYEEDRVISYNSDHYCEARAIAAELSPPSDPDRADAERIAAAYCGNVNVDAVLNGIKHGRELARGEQA